MHSGQLSGCVLTVTATIRISCAVSLPQRETPREWLADEGTSGDWRTLNTRRQAGSARLWRVPGGAWRPAKHGRAQTLAGQPATSTPAAQGQGKQPCPQRKGWWTHLQDEAEQEVDLLRLDGCAGVGVGDVVAATGAGGGRQELTRRVVIQQLARGVVILDDCRKSKESEGAAVRGVAAARALVESSASAPSAVPPIPSSNRMSSPDATPPVPRSCSCCAIRHPALTHHRPHPLRPQREDPSSWPSARPHRGALPTRPAHSARPLGSPRPSQPHAGRRHDGRLERVHGPKRGQQLRSAGHGAWGRSVDLELENWSEQHQAAAIASTTAGMCDSRTTARQPYGGAVGG